MEGRGFLAAAFRHRLSRAGDPLLHTHVVVANVTQGTDGRWTSLDGTALYAHAKTAGYLYQELTRRLEVEWSQPRNGMADLVGIDRGVIEAFSRRSDEIRAYLDAHPELDDGPRATQIAALATRAAKESGVTVETLREEWRELAGAHGLDERALRALTRRARGANFELEARAPAERLAGPHGLTRQRSSFGLREALQAWAQELRCGAPVTTVERLADRFLEDRAVVLAERAHGLTDADVIRRADGRVVSAAADERRYSTAELLDVERRAIEHALAGADAGVAKAAPEVLTNVLCEPGRELAPDQAAVVETLTTSGAAVQVLVGPPGTGKTYSLACARQAWERSEAPVIGATLAARAAAELRDGAGIDSYTIARLLIDLREAGPSGALRPGTVVVDEAAMVGSRQLAELIDHAMEARAKVVLVGDHRQLPAIDAGGLFRALESRGRALGITVELSENRRQRDAWAREALAAWRDGHVDEALGELGRHGQVVVADDPAAARRALVADWWRSVAGPDPVPTSEAAMVAYRWADVEDLNLRARELMRHAGHLGQEELEATEQRFAVGDRVVATGQSAKRLGMANATRGEVTDVDLDQRALTVRRDRDGAHIPLGPRYLDSGELRHAYAVTAHKSQGMTVEHAFVLGGRGIYGELAYTALTRARGQARLYITAPQAPEHAEGPIRNRSLPTALDKAVSELRRSRAHEAARDTASRAEVEREPTHRLYAERRALRRAG